MALSAAVQWDVRTTGNDANGGAFDPSVVSPGTDFSQQNSPQVAFTDLVIGATTTQLTSVLNPFNSTYVGNLIQIVSGTGFTVGFYTVVSVSGITATMDRSVGSAASTGGNGNLGGSLATIGAANTACVAGNTVNIKAGTYTLTASITIAVSTITWTGYNTTHNDGGTKPLITTATNSVVLINTGSANSGQSVFNNLSLSNTATARASGIWQLSAHGTAQWWIFNDCLFDGFTSGIDNSNGTPDDVAFVVVNRTEVKNCTVAGYNSGNATEPFVAFTGCYFHSNQVNITTGGGQTIVSAVNCIIVNAVSHGLLTAGSYTLVENCTIAGNGGTGFFPSSSLAVAKVINSIFYGNNEGIQLGAANNNTIASAVASRNNAFGANSLANANWNGSVGDVSLTANPFTNAGAGDYSLNTTAGGGAALIGKGFPGVFPGGLSTSHLDIGAVQSTGGGSGGGGSYTFLS
jgi:hypothetical protein